MGTLPTRLTRNLTHDFRASLHGLSMALELAAEGLPPETDARIARYLSLASTEAVRLDRTVEQLGLWLRLQHGQFKVRTERLNLRDVVAERLGQARAAGATYQVEVPDSPVMVVADSQLLRPSIDGLADFLTAFALQEEGAVARLSPAGALTLVGPPAWAPIFRTAATGQLPDPTTLKGPVRWLVGLCLAGMVCRTCGGEVTAGHDSGKAVLTLTWFRAG